MAPVQLDGQDFPNPGFQFRIGSSEYKILLILSCSFINNHDTIEPMAYLIISLKEESFCNSAKSLSFDA